jgi:hypothetical protein
MKASNYVNNVFQFRGLLPTLQANIGIPYFSFCPEDRLENALQRKPLFSAGASVRVQARQTFPLEWYCLRERITVYRLNSFSGSNPLLVPYRPIKPSNGGAPKAFFSPSMFTVEGLRLDLVKCTTCIPTELSN